MGDEAEVKALPWAQTPRGAHELSAVAADTGRKKSAKTERQILLGGVEGG